MKHRMVFVAVGAGIGFAYLTLGAFLLRWIGSNAIVVEIWSGLAGFGVVVNVIVPLAWSDDEDIAASAGRLLLLQSYLPLAVVLTSLAAFCTPLVFLAVWCVQALAIGPCRVLHASFVRRRMGARIAAVGRCLAWPDLEPLLVRGEGVLILDSTACRPGLVWWSDDASLADPGLLVMADDRFVRVTHDQLDKGTEYLLPLTAFLARYLDPQTGEALLTPLTAKAVASKRFLRAYPHIAVFAVDASQGRMPAWRRTRRAA